MSDHDAREQRFSVSVLGLGYMGSALARAFLAKQHTVTVWNRTASKAQPLAEAGAEAAASVAEAIDASDVTVVCVLDYAMGVMPCCVRHRWLIDSKGRRWSNSRPARPRKLGPARPGRRSMASHIWTGRSWRTPHEVGTPDCTLLYAGPQAVFDRNKPLLLSLGGNSVFLGENPGHAAALEGSLLSFLYAAWIGFLHGAALCESEGISIESYLSSDGSNARQSGDSPDEKRRRDGPVSGATSVLSPR